MKICHIITRMIVGGAQENTLLTCIGLIEMGHKVTLLTGPTEGPEGRLLEKNKLVKELNVVVIPSLIRAINPIKDLKAYFQIKKYLEIENFDVVHTHASKAGIIGRIAATNARVKNVFHTVHGPPFHRYEKKWKNFIYILAEKIAARYCKKIFTVADAMTSQFIEAGIGEPSMYKTVYSGMDIEAFMNAVKSKELMKELHIPSDAIVIGKVARLFDLKGHEYLIDAVKGIIDEFPNIKFLLVGDGTLRNKFEKMIKAQNLENYFIFVGLIPPEKVCNYIALMDLLVHFSLREGLPRTVVQALAGGKPVVAFPLDGTPEVVIDGETGFLAETQNSKSIAEIIKKMLRNPQKMSEMGIKGQKLVKNKFDWRQMASILEKEYD